MSSLSAFPKIGPKTLEKLDRLGIKDSLDLLHHFPSRYLDFSQKIPIATISENQMVTITGKIITFQNIFTRHGKNIQKAIIGDSTGQIELIWFNQPYLSKILVPDSIHSFAGTSSLFQKRLTLISPIHGDHQTGRILPIYPETAGINSGWFRSFFNLSLDSLLSEVTETLPPEIIKKYHLISLNSALKEIHSPQSLATLEAARLRLSLDEILALQTQSYLRRANWATKTPQVVFKTNKTIDNKIDKFISSLPFTLTPSQVKAWSEIKTNLLGHISVNRLLQGDVGSGKTVVAMLACYLASLNKTNSLVLAPTEILAKQHLASFKKMLPIPIEILTAKTKLDFTQLKPGTVIISTHAAIYHKKHFEDNTGLIIIDEQHKFGVEQRTFLSNSLHPPHCLTMTATPIPRTISLTILGNLDLSLLESPPENRKKIKTYLVPQNKYSQCYQWLDDHIKATHEQAFIVCPFIEPSETLSSVKSAKELFVQMEKRFPHYHLDLIHGSVKETERQAILEKFNRNEIQILVTTPIIEVGIDFPNATTIIIQSADRFGLAQLHQLRGRVGRSHRQSYCYFFSDSDNEKSQGRLQMLEKTSDGQKIAEYDLQTRGPGEAFSYIQHGFPSLKIANLSDYKLINLGQEIISQVLKQYPNFDLNKLANLSEASLASTN